MSYRIWAVTLTASAVVGLGLGVATARVADGATEPALSDYWTQQSYNDCVEMAARVVVADKAGLLLTEAQVTDTASQVTDYTPGGGTPWAQTPAILKAYGVHSYLTAGANVDDLRALRAAGADVIVAVNSYKLWTAAGLKGQTDHGDSDHAVVVDTITDTDVTVVDSAWDGGKHETVPLAAFVNAYTATGGATFAVVAQ